MVTTDCADVAKDAKKKGCLKRIAIASNANPAGTVRIFAMKFGVKHVDFTLMSVAMAILVNAVRIALGHSFQSASVSASNVSRAGNAKTPAMWLNASRALVTLWMALARIASQQSA